MRKKSSHANLAEPRQHPGAPRQRAEGAERGGMACELARTACFFVCFVACLFCVLSVCCVFGGFFFSFLFVIGCSCCVFLFFVVEAFICVSQVAADWWSGTVGGKPFFFTPKHQSKPPTSGKLSFRICTICVIVPCRSSH